MAYYDLAANSTSTLLKDNLLGSPASAAASHIYAAGLNFNSLSLLEQWWAKWYLYVGDPVLATGIMSFLIHEIFYFGRCTVDDHRSNPLFQEMETTRGKDAYTS